MDSNREYKIEIDPRILELLGPNLYTNIYYVLSELIANAYDADASNVYIIEDKNSITVEDDGTGMSYKDHDVEGYLKVAVETRTDNSQTYTSLGRKKMGRKGIGKLAALSVSDEIFVVTKKSGEKSGFILSTHVGPDHKLEALKDEQITFKKINDLPHGTSIVMNNPRYKLNKTPDVIKRNLLKIFPMVNSSFKIHIITSEGEIVIDSFEQEMIEQLGALITLGEENKYLEKHFNSGFTIDKNEREKKLIQTMDAFKKTLQLENKKGVQKDYILEIKGWIGIYKTTRGRKTDKSDFPDNFISLLSNEKLGEYNILPIVGRNRLNEAYVVGQLYIDLFEETELPDMALSSRQGYKSDDQRYETVIEYIREILLPKVVALRVEYADFVLVDKNKAKVEMQKQDEEELRKMVEKYKHEVSETSASKIVDKLGKNSPKGFGKAIESDIRKELNEKLSFLGIKKRVDEQKRKILICHTGADKPLADIIYKMLLFNGFSEEDIIYTSSESEFSRIPNRMNIFEYLRTFFVDSYSDKKIFVIYVTSDEMSKSWYAVSEVGAGWITEVSHEIFNIHAHKPQPPLDVTMIYQTSKKDGQNISMTRVEEDIFVVKIRDICSISGYTPKGKAENMKELERYITIE